MPRTNIEGDLKLIVGTIKRYLNSLEFTRNIHYIELNEHYKHATRHSSMMGTRFRAIMSTRTL